MAAADVHRAALAGLDDWEPYLAAHSGLPGPRANLELAAVVAELGTPAQLERCAAADDEFEALCGAIGLARAGDVRSARRLANDPRWRVREGVAIGLQLLADTDLPRVLAIVADWGGGSDLERRAAMAAICEPRLLRDPAAARAALDLLDRLTERLATAVDRRDHALRVLRKALAYGWSVAVAALPDDGRPRFERWLDDPDPDVRLVLRENLKKARLARLDPAWVEACRRRVT